MDNLNTPVAALSLLINGALDGMFTLDEKLLSDMKKENDTLAARIQSVGYYSFLMSPDAKAEKSEVSFLSASDDVLQKKGCMCIVPESDVMVYADLGLFERALCEVVQNAVDYRSDDEPPRLEASDKDGGVEIIMVISLSRFHSSLSLGQEVMPPAHQVVLDLDFLLSIR